MPTTRRKTIEPETATVRFEVKLPPALYNAVTATAAKSRETLGAICRRALAREIGKPELGGSRPRGRPVESDQE